MPLGIYISVPFCRSKCSYCNFASDVFAPRLRSEYVRLLRRELELAVAAEGLEGAVVDSIYWGGGTPTLLDPADLAAIVGDLKRHFQFLPDAEHTFEAAPGTLPDATLETLQRLGVNRLSLGVQSFQDEETRAVARMHGRQTTLTDFRRLREHGFHNFGADLIAGLPYQTEASWRESLGTLTGEQVPHASVYMLEVDEDSRLGTELLAGGQRYHAHQVPDEDQVADFYELACELLPAAGLGQYEISNFARAGFTSRHNERYWLRQPYLGLGVDAHSMLRREQAQWSVERGAWGETRTGGEGGEEVRFANVDRMEEWMAALREDRLPRATRQLVTPQQRLEETLFLGLRRNCGVDRERIDDEFGAAAWPMLDPVVKELREEGLLEADEPLRLTRRGRMLSNDVFERFLEME